MGQYYKFMVGKKWDYPVGISSYVYDNGAKLMEHSYVGNRYVDAAIRLMKYMEKESGEPNRVVWMGDYGDEVLPDIISDNKNDGVKCKFLYASYVKAWMYDGGEFIPALDTDELPNLDYEHLTHSKGGIVCNMDTKEYVRVPPDTGEWPWSIHPLPLLTSVGNGCGGGDYCGTCMDAIGIWAGDHVTWISDEDAEVFIDNNNLKYLDDIVFKEERE